MAEDANAFEYSNLSLWLKTSCNKTL